MIQCSQKSSRSRESMTENIRINTMNQVDPKSLRWNDPTMRNNNQRKRIKGTEYQKPFNDPVIDKNMLAKRINEVQFI